MKIRLLLAGLVLLPMLVFWYLVVHQDDEILALVRSDVAIDEAAQRRWLGRFVNTHDNPLRDVAVVVDFLDAQNRAIGKGDARIAELAFGEPLTVQAALPVDAVRLRIASVRWRMGTHAVVIGPFRDPWEFGYVMVAPAAAGAPSR